MRRKARAPGAPGPPGAPPGGAPGAAAALKEASVSWSPAFSASISFFLRGRRA